MRVKLLKRRVTIVQRIWGTGRKMVLLNPEFLGSFFSPKRRGNSKHVTVRVVLRYQLVPTIKTIIYHTILEPLLVLGRNPKESRAD